MYCTWLSVIKTKYTYVMKHFNAFEAMIDKVFTRLRQKFIKDRRRTMA